ncbi:uncharacterized protein LOC130662429 [Hydractinia symbiolongicarpus]|uniref:uncharacterized protein LOC130662429 n=1 Tax=Hydractinia symbiolongicarpus TaxID=13093 RepID=UPI00254AB470|nr:uncharacterized protein LOC130662429 [Hydractinia symbiolongicarpus]
MMRGKFALVKGDRGGGLRSIKLPSNASYDDLLNTCKELFWEKRNNPLTFGTSDVTFFLVDIRREVVNNILTTNANQQIPFTIELYCQKTKMARTKFIFKTKCKTIQMIQDLTAPIFVSSDNDESDDFVPARGFRTSTPLIGTSHERAEVRQEMDNAYSAFLASDRKKAQEKADIEKRNLRLQSLNAARKSRVPPEALLTDDHCTISIHHPAEGRKTRLFHARETMTVVYDWAGSLSIEPEHYDILDFTGKVIVPDSSIKSGMFHIRERDDPVNMTS